MKKIKAKKLTFEKILVTELNLQQKMTIKGGQHYNEPHEHPSIKCQIHLPTANSCRGNCE
jgi:hypothetical protein